MSQIEEISAKETIAAKTNKRKETGMREAPNSLMELSVDLFMYVIIVISNSFTLHLSHMLFLQVHTCGNTPHSSVRGLQVHVEIVHGQLFSSAEERNVSPDKSLLYLWIFSSNKW